MRCLVDDTLCAGVDKEPNAYTVERGKRELRSLINKDHLRPWQCDECIERLGQPGRKERIDVGCGKGMCATRLLIPHLHVFVGVDALPIDE
jgi:hypothetical protein